MDLSTFVQPENAKRNTLLTIYLRYTHLEIPVFTAILDRIWKMHQTITGLFNNSFMFPEFPDEGLRNVLQLESITTSTSSTSITIVFREGWAPAFQSERDNFLVEVPYTLGIPAIITLLLFSTLGEPMVSSSNILIDMKRTLESEIEDNQNIKKMYDALQQSSIKEQLAELAVSLIQVTKSIDALRSVSVNGFNILSFDINRRKYKRYFVQFTVRIGCNDEICDAIIENISRGGCVCKLSGPEEMRSGQNIIIQFPGFEMTPSDVRSWGSGGEFFIRAIFDPPMEESQLKELLK
jgi:hypothetical protein